MSKKLSKQDTLAYLAQWARDNSGPGGDVPLGELLDQIRTLGGKINEK